MTRRARRSCRRRGSNAPRVEREPLRSPPLRRTDAIRSGQEHLSTEDDRRILDDGQAMQAARREPRSHAELCATGVGVPAPGRARCARRARGARPVDERASRADGRTSDPAGRDKVIRRGWTTRRERSDDTWGRWQPRRCARPSTSRSRRGRRPVRRVQPRHQRDGEQVRFGVGGVRAMAGSAAARGVRRCHGVARCGVDRSARIAAASASAAPSATHRGRQSLFPVVMTLAVVVTALSPALVESRTGRASLLA